MTKRNIFSGLRGDGSKWGVSDLYPEHESALVRALAEGAESEWTTGWWASRKEVVSGSIDCVGGQLVCRVSVSDDLEVEGNGEQRIPWTSDLADVIAALDEAHDAAKADQEENGSNVYQGWSVHRRAADGSVGSWIETYIEPRGYGCDMPQPPGDNYHRWGWQGEADLGPEAIVAIEEYLRDLDTTPDGPVLVGGYWLSPWRR